MTGDNAQERDPPTAVRNLMRRLADIDAGELPFLSIYLDVRPEKRGERPSVREGLVILRDRLRDIRKTYWPRGPQLESLDADAARIDVFVHEQMQVSTQGVAIFACHARNVWETFEAGAPLDHQVTVAPHADLFQLAKLVDEYETSVIGVLDTNTARFFAYQFGRLVPTGGPDDDPESYRRTDVGGWSQARYQRHIDKHRKTFAKEIVRALDDLVEREKATRVVLAGDEVVMEALRPEMPGQLARKVVGTFRANIHENVNDIADEARPLLERAERHEDMSAVERLIDEVRSGGLGVAGLEPTKQALTFAQVHTLVIDDAATASEDRAELVRMAVETDADVEVVHDAQPLPEMGGVGGLLRYRLPAVL